MKLVVKKLVAVMFIITLLSAVGFINNVIVEANASIGFKTTNISLQNGRCIIYGYFYNNGNSGATVTSVRFVGNIYDSSGKSMYNIDQIWNGTKAGYIAPGAQKSWSFTSDKNIYKYYRGNPEWNFNTTVSWR